MSMPQFPTNDPSLTREGAINQIISSIAMEELGLSHIINAEGEKLQYALGTIPGVTGLEEPMTIEDLLELNKSVHQTLNGAMMNQLFLKDKLQNALSASVMQGPTGPAGPQGPAHVYVDPEVIPLGPDDSPTVENVGPSDQEVILQFGIPRGATGATGPTGPTGPQGMAATISVESTIRVPYTADAHVYNVGTPQNAVLVFEIPAGEPGLTPHIDTDTGHWFIGNVDTGVSAQGPTGETGPVAATIPFSISKYGIYLSTDAQGAPLMVAFSGFGSSYYDAATYLQEGEWSTGTITFREDMNYGTAFIMPHDVVLNKIHVLFSTGWDASFTENSTIRPFACLAVSNSDDLEYTILQDTMTFTEPYAGGVDYPRHTIRRGFLSDLNIEIAEGTLVAIVAGIMGENITTEQTAMFSVSGGLYLE